MKDRIMMMNLKNQIIKIQLNCQYYTKEILKKLIIKCQLMIFIMMMKLITSLK